MGARSGRRGAAARLAQVRHNGGHKTAKSFRINLGSRRVYTTFAIEFEALGEVEPELVQQFPLLGGGLGDAPQTNLAPVGGRQHDVGALQGGRHG